MSTSLARRFKFQVSTDNASWLSIAGITDLSPNETPTLVAADDYDSNGFSNWEKTMTGAKVVVKANRKTTAGTFDPGQELVRQTRFQFGDQARIYIRWYDRNGAAEAYSGRALVDWQQSKTGVADLEEVTLSFTIDGVLASIANPWSATAVPVIASATPSGATAGTQVQITGGGFNGTIATTGVKFGATNATSWTVVSDSTIVAIVPTGSAGAANIVVTNAAGASTAFSYVRGA
jgi:hypothetical protein